MTMRHHRLVLTGQASEQRVRVPMATLADALDALLEGARAAARFAVEGESVRKGKRPAWLEAACEFDVTGLSSGSAVIDIEAPPLGDVSPLSASGGGPDLFRDDDARSLGDRTAIELLGDVLVAGLDPRADDVRADRALLESCARLARIVSGTGYDGLRLEGLGGDRHHVELVPASAERYDRLRDLTPAAKAVLLRASLDTISATSPAVVLRLADGTKVSARLENQDRDGLAALFGSQVTVSGKLYFRASGGPLHIIAESIRPATEQDRVFDALPIAPDLAPVVDPAALEAARGVSAFFGTWPGDETEEELLEMVRTDR